MDIDALGVPAVALCSKTISALQVEKLVRFARPRADVQVTLLLDGDAEGENGAKQALLELAPTVASGWDGRPRRTLSSRGGSRSLGQKTNRLRFAPDGDVSVCHQSNVTIRTSVACDDECSTA
ncbi:MAG: hypothetical protein IT428_16815 [Planctomycetaceae bacterium]|nr:hypothetical protein [Planctomycetaceae bacterium]